MHKYCIIFFITLFLNSSALYGNWLQTPCINQIDCTINNAITTNNNGLVSIPNTNNTHNTITINSNGAINNNILQTPTYAIITIRGGNQINITDITNNGTIGKNINTVQNSLLGFSIRNYAASSGSLESQIGTLINNGTIQGKIVNYTTINTLTNNGELKDSIYNLGSIQTLTHSNSNAPIKIDGLNPKVQGFIGTISNLILGNNTTIEFANGITLLNPPTFEGNATIKGDVIINYTGDLQNNSTYTLDVNYTNINHLTSFTNQRDFSHIFINRQNQGTLDSLTNQALFNIFRNEHILSSVINENSGTFTNLTNTGIVDTLTNSGNFEL
ncbi:hypothetical protein OQH60_08160, partial [Campylobacter sp. MIT 21-1685]|uniref:hypothetical protein n=1 Tax=unclassified Campylobacter TaxID=2593542 RepID=UPI00224AA737